MYLVVVKVGSAMWVVLWVRRSRKAERKYGDDGVMEKRETGRAHALGERKSAFHIWKTCQVMTEPREETEGGKGNRTSWKGGRQKGKERKM